MNRQQKLSAEGNKRKEKVSGEGGDHARPLLAPTKVPLLPGFMSKALVNPAVDEKNLVFINVRFFKETYVTTYGVRLDDGKVEEMDAGRYADHKNRFQNLRKVEEEAKALKGFRMKLHNRLMIVTGMDDAALKVAMSKPFDRVFLDLMTKSQKEFDELYPNPSSVIDFWDSRAPEVKVFASNWAGHFGDPDWTNRLKEEKETFKARLAAKAAKAEAQKKKKLEESSKPAKEAGVPPEPPALWADEEEDDIPVWKLTDEKLKELSDSEATKLGAEKVTQFKKVIATLQDPGAKSEARKRAIKWSEWLGENYKAYSYVNVPPDLRPSFGFQGNPVSSFKTGLGH